jgi:hypothetical protein
VERYCKRKLYARQKLRTETIKQFDLHQGTILLAVLFLFLLDGCVPNYRVPKHHTWHSDAFMIAVRCHYCFSAQSSARSNHGLVKSEDDIIVPLISSLVLSKIVRYDCAPR